MAWPRSSAPADAEVLTVGPLAVYPREQLARVDGRAVALAARGAAVLAALARADGAVLARPRLYREVWHAPMRRGDRSVDVQVAKLRRALATACPQWRLIATHHGRGYSLAPERARRAAPRAPSVVVSAAAVRRSTSLLVAGPLEIAPAAHLAVIEGASCRLRPLDTRVLVALAQAPGHVIGREQLFAAIGRPDAHPEDRTIDVAICRLRARFAAAAPRWELIHTHPARGYRFEPARRRRPAR